MKKLNKILKKETRKIFKVFLHPTFVYLTVVGNSILIFATVAVYYLEKDSPKAQIKTYFDSIWWGVSTITTVAYGDILPQTFWARIIGIFLMYTGTVLFISFTGLLLSNLMKEEVEGEIAPLQKEMRLEEEKQKVIEESLKKMSERLERIENLLIK